MIEVRNYTKTYGDFLAVQDLSFRVEPGQILGLLGPNGAGKTTTLRAIVGVLQPTHGQLLVDGHDVEADPVAAKRELAYVPDDPRLFDALTVWEHLVFTAHLYQVQNFEPIADRLLDQFELKAKRNTVCQELSRGMRQKVAICCAYLHNPKAILLDEPLTGLDPRGIRTLKDSIVERAASGAAILVSSHLLALIENLCTHLLIIVNGSRKFVGTTEEARKSFADLSGDNSLEELFFRATENVVPPVIPTPEHVLPDSEPPAPQNLAATNSEELRP